MHHYQHSLNTYHYGKLKAYMKIERKASCLSIFQLQQLLPDGQFCFFIPLPTSLSLPTIHYFKANLRHIISSVNILGGEDSVFKFFIYNLQTEKHTKHKFINFFYCFIIHMCMQCLGHFSPLHPPPPLDPLHPLSLPPTPSIPGRNYFALISNFVEERV
jgi:hypothetical protein